MKRLTTMGCLKYSDTAVLRSEQRFTPWKDSWYLQHSDGQLVMHAGNICSLSNLHNACTHVNTHTHQQRYSHVVFFSKWLSEMWAIRLQLQAQNSVCDRDYTIMFYFSKVAVKNRAVRLQLQAENSVTGTIVMCCLSKVAVRKRPAVGLQLQA